MKNTEQEVCSEKDIILQSRVANVIFRWFKVQIFDKRENASTAVCVCMHGYSAYAFITQNN